MSLEKEFDTLEGKYYDEMEENRDELIPTLVQMHQARLEKGGAEVEEFSKAISSRFGGIYIPFLFWIEVRKFIDEDGDRAELFRLIKEFCDSGFEDPERKRMKSLVITYFASEKEFEINKIQSLIIDKSHPKVIEYFEKLTRFSSKNPKSVEMYLSKFDLIKDKFPDFDLISLPLMKLKERLAEA